MNLAYEILMMIGIIALAISGSLSAMENRFDFFGVLSIAIATSFGGGTIRDMLIEREVFWISDPMYIYALVASCVFSIIFRKYLDYLRTTLLLFDTIGLGLFTILGVEIGYQFNLAPPIGIALGVMTGVFGGVMRDVLVNDVPILFKKEIYASISIAGGAIYVSLKYFDTPEFITKLVSVSFIIIARLIVIRYKIALPSFYRDEKK